MTASLFLHQVIDASSRVVPGATLTFRQGFRPGEIFHDPERRTPARNPFPADGAGRVRLYLNAGETYEVTVESPNGDRYQFVHVARADGETVTETVEVVREVPVETIVERVVEVADPEQAARIAELEARLAKHEAVKPDAPIPDELADLISYADTPAQTSEKLLVRLREVLGLIGLAEDAGGRAAPELYRKRDRLESGIRWNRGRSAEVI